MRDILEKEGLIPDHIEGLHVHFESRREKCEDDDFYGASVPLSIVLDPTRPVLLAWGMNGEDRLPVANGFPLRVIIPGVIGARCVKWLESITVKDCEVGPPFVHRADKH